MFLNGYVLREEPCTDQYAQFCGQTGVAAPSDPIRFCQAACMLLLKSALVAVHLFELRYFSFISVNGYGTPDNL